MATIKHSSGLTIAINGNGVSSCWMNFPPQKIDVLPTTHGFTFEITPSNGKTLKVMGISGAYEENNQVFLKLPNQCPFSIDAFTQGHNDIANLPACDILTIEERLNRETIPRRNARLCPLLELWL